MINQSIFQVIKFKTIKSELMYQIHISSENKLNQFNYKRIYEQV